MEESKEEYIEKLVRSRPSNRWNYQFILVASTTTLLAVMSYIYVQTGVCPSILRDTKACDVYESIFYAPFFSDVVKVYVFIIFGILISHPIGMLAKFCTGYSSEPPRECRRCREELDEEENEEEHLVEGDGEDSEEGDEEDSEEGEGEASEESEEDNKDEVSKGKNEQQSTKKSSQAEKDQKDQSHSSEGTSSSDDEQDDDVIIRNEKVAEEEVVEEMENTEAHSSENTVDTITSRVSPTKETATVVQQEKVSDVKIQSEDVQDIASTFEEPTTVADTRDDKRESSEFESKTLDLDEIDQTPLNEKETVTTVLVEKEADDATVDTSIQKQKEDHDEEVEVPEASESDPTTVNDFEKVSSENDLPQEPLSEPDISVEEESNDNATEENGSEDLQSSSKPSATMDICSKFAEDMKKCYQALEDIEEDRNLAQVLNLVTETCQVLSESHNGAEDTESSSKTSPTTPINSDASFENSVDTSTFAEDMKKCYQALEEIEEDKNLAQVLNLATDICQVLSESHKRKTEKVGELDAACEKSDVPRSGANEHEFRQAVEESEEANNSEHSPISDYGTEAFTYDGAESNIDMLSIDSKRETRDAPQSDVAAESVMQPSPIPSEKDSGMNTAESSDTETQPRTKKSSNTLDSSEPVSGNESDDSEMEQNKTHVLSLVEVADAKVLEKHLIHEAKIDSADELDESSTF